MLYDIKKKILIFAFILLAIPGLKASEIEKISEIMPYGTKLLSQYESSENKINVTKYYRYGTTTTKENVLEFYQKLFLEEGYADIGKEINDKGSVYFFKKEKQTAAMGILAQQEKGLNVYLVILSKPIQGQ